MRSQARRHCSRSSATPAAYADGSARTTRSTFGRTGSMSSRTISRRRRFTRLRSTAECECLGTMIPALGWRRRETTNRTSRCAVRSRFPCRRTSSSASSRVSRQARGKRRSSDACVLRRQFDGQTLPALLAAAAQRLASPLRFHSRAKSMRCNSTLVPRTIGRLPHMNSK